MAAMMVGSTVSRDGSTVTYSGRSSLVGEGIDARRLSDLRRDVLERENQALTMRLHEAERVNAKKSAECERLQQTLADKDEEDDQLRRRMMELEISHAQLQSVETALEVASVAAAEAEAQAAEARAQVAEAQAMAAEAEEKVAKANARADAANRFKEEAVNVAKRARAEAAAGGRGGGGGAATSQSPQSTSKPVAADAAGGMAGFSPLTAARARADSTSKECDQLRGMVNDLSATLRKRGLHALQRVGELEEERDAAEEERDKLLETKRELTGQIEGMRWDGANKDSCADPVDFL